ncbi:MAG: GDYXXLXY domain-containing protein [Hyphomicrobium sp.]
MNYGQTSPMRSALIAVALLQSLVLGWMVFDRVSLLSNGREIKAAVVPVDPRDIFRGDYVTLGYGFSTGAELALPEGVRQGDTIYALLKSNGPAEWTLAGVSEAEPVVSGYGEVVLKANVDYVRRSPQPGAATVGRLRYGIERFYVPEGTGRDLEAQVREKRIVAVLAVGSDGKVALKGLEADGKRIVEEPLL